LVQKASAVLVGSETLMGRELRDVCAGGGIDLRLLAAGGEEAGRVTEQHGEPAIIPALDAIRLAEAGVAFLAGSPESAKTAIGYDLDIDLVDLTYAGEDHPAGRVRAPMAETGTPAGTRLHVVAHSGAIALALLVTRLHAAYPVRRWVAQVFEPASERGLAGIAEMQQQTVNLLSFKTLPKAVFDAQAAFNMLARYGEDAPDSLESQELRMERHLRHLLAGRAPMPSLRLVHAPVFHGQSFSLWIEFEQNPGAAAVEQALASEFVDVRGGDLDAPDNVGAAGQSGVIVGAVGLDRMQPEACWLWAVADNLRLRAENAVLVAKERL
jgi:aspartate-semialdehyde dehydrogenase